MYAISRLDTEYEVPLHLLSPTLSETSVVDRGIKQCSKQTLAGNQSSRKAYFEIRVDDSGCS